MMDRRVIYPVAGKAPVYVPRRLIDADRRPPRSMEVLYDTVRGRPLRAGEEPAPEKPFGMRKRTVRPVGTTDAS